MFIASKSVEYPPYIGPPQYFTSVFIIISIVRSPCFVENISSVKLPPKKISLSRFHSGMFHIQRTFNREC